MLQKPRGTRDFLPEEMERRRIIEQRMRDTAMRWGYREVCTPTFETLELFTMRSGEGIIQEMYTFEDKGGRELALRPEVTAPVLRMYVNEGKVLPKPLRWCYFADCFRYERPQKGRYRQFWQFGIELIGADSASAEAEVILAGYEILKNAGVQFTLHIGHLAPMRSMLSGLDATVAKTVMGLLDKRDFEGLEQCLTDLGHHELLDSLTGLVQSRTIDEAVAICGDIPERERIEETFAILDGLDLPYTLNMGIVRGLDYYTGTVFEAFAENLGAENQIMGGGVYRLAHLFGGDDVASCGFAIGFDRVMVSLGETELARPPVVAVLATSDARSRSFEVARAFREAGICAELNLMDRGIGAQMKHAAKSSNFALIIGERELAGGTVTLKNLQSGEQCECGVDEAIAEVKGIGAC
jgi:histidyl-tRNA synthetase